MKLRPYSRRVYYYETDKMGIVHHSNYIRWFEEARVDLIEQAGLPFQLVEEEGLMTPVLSANVNISCHSNSAMYLSSRRIFPISAGQDFP